MERTYGHAYVRVDYPRERGYRMEVFALPNWLCVKIKDVGENSRECTVHSSIHKASTKKLQYSASFSDTDILKDSDLNSWICNFIN